MKQETLDKVLHLVENANDAEIRMVQEAMRRRWERQKNARRREALATIDVGDAVVLHSIKPKYLSGCTGRVAEMRGTNFVVRLDEDVDPRATRRFGRTVICRPTTVRKI